MGVVMSQTETLMLFVLGFCAALLIVLMFGRALWSMIGRWSGWQQQRQIPIAIRELQADRDSLKAEKAIMARKLESGVNDMKMRMAEQMAEVSRNRNRVLDLTAKLNISMTLASNLQSELRGKHEQVAALNVQIEENVKAINTAWTKTAERETEVAKFKQLQTHTDKILADRDQRISKLENEANALREIVGMLVPSPKPVGQLQAAPMSVELRPRDAGSELNGQSQFPIPLIVASNGMAAISSAYDPAVSALSTNSFESRFNAGGNPFAPIDATNERNLNLPSAVNDSTLQQSHSSDDDESVEISKGISNVLSLVQRFRGLQKGMKE